MNEDLKGILWAEFGILVLASGMVLAFYTNIDTFWFDTSFFKFCCSLGIVRYFWGAAIFYNNDKGGKKK